MVPTQPCVEKEQKVIECLLVYAVGGSDAMWSVSEQNWAQPKFGNALDQFGPQAALHFMRLLALAVVLTWCWVICCDVGAAPTSECMSILNVEERKLDPFLCCSLLSDQHKFSVDNMLWVNVSATNSQSTGTRDDPFRDFEDFVYWLREFGLGPRRVTLKVAPGRYNSTYIAVDRVQLTIERWDDTEGDIMVEVNEKPFLRAGYGSATSRIADITFLGNGSMLSLASSQSSVLEFSEENGEIGNVKFVSIHRSTSLITKSASSGVLRISHVLFTGNTITKQDGQDSLVRSTLIYSASKIQIRGSTFSHNRLLVPIFVSEVGCTVLLAEKSMDISDSLFLDNGVSINLIETPSELIDSFGGAICAYGSAKDSRSLYLTTISNTVFDGNFVEDSTGEAQPKGGAIALPHTSYNLSILNCTFQNNRARLGGAISDHSDGDSTARDSGKTLILIDATSFINNTANFRGGALNLAPIQETNVTITNSIFHLNKLAESEAHLSSGIELFGGASVSFVVPLGVFREFIDTRLSMNNVSITNGSFSNPNGLPAAVGCAILAHRVLYLSFADCIIANHSTDFTSLFRVHEFGYMALGRSIIQDNRAIRVKSPAKISIVLDLQDDFELAFNPANTPSIHIYSTQFTGNLASYHVFISNVGSTLIEDSHSIEPEPKNPEQSAEKNGILLSITAIRDHTVLRNWTSHNTVYPIYLAYMPELNISDSRFQHFYGGTGSSVVLAGITNGLINGSTWSDNRVTSLTVSFSSIRLLNSSFVRNKGENFGGALLLDDTPAKIDACLFELNEGRDGGAITTNSHLEVNQSTMSENNATRGGAIFTTSASLNLAQLRCLDNFAMHTGGCLCVLFTQLAPIIGEKVNWAVLKQSEFANNFAMSDGGAVWFSPSSFSNPNSAFWIYSSSFIDNAAFHNGGALFGGSYRIMDSNFSRNTAGFLPLFTSRASQVFGEFASHSSSNKLSQPIFAEPSSPRPVFVEDQAVGLGGALYLLRASLSISNCLFDHNIAQLNGGAIMLLNMFGASVIEHTTFENNAAGLAGGAVSVVSSRLSFQSHSASIDNITFSNNLAAYGGALEWSPSLSEVIALSLTSATFTCNRAVISGGAIYTTSPARGYPTTRNVNFIDNSANVSGGIFFYNGESPYPPPSWCPMEKGCNISTSPLGTCQATFHPIWGPIQASSGLVPLFVQIKTSSVISNVSSSSSSLSIDTNLSNSIEKRISESNGQQIVDVHPGEFLVVLEFVDLFGQISKDRLSIGTAQISNFTSSYCKSGLHCPISIVAYAGDAEEAFSNEIRISAVLGKELWNPIVRYTSTTGHGFSPLPINASLMIRLSTLDERAMKEQETPIDLAFILRGCPVGFGLQPYGTETSFVACAPCPVGTYNLDGDGQCYACDDGGAVSVLSCEASTVSYFEGFWASKISSHSDQLFVGRCMHGYCDKGVCASGREGVLCGDCEEGKFESLLSCCSAELCAKPNAFFLLLSLVSLLIVPLLLNHLLYHFNAQTMHFIFVFQMVIMILQTPLDWAIPLAFPTFASLICGFRTSPIRRHITLSLAPYLTIVLLWITFMLHRIVAKIVKLFIPNSYPSSCGESMLSRKRLEMTTIAILYLLSPWSIKMALDWTLCTETPFGNRWTLSPSVHCDTPQFSASRALTLLVTVPLAILPLLGAMAYWTIHLVVERSSSSPSSSLSPSSLLSTSKKDHWILSTFAPETFHFISSDRSKLWPFMDVAARVAVPCILSLAVLSEVAQSSSLGLIFVGMMSVSVFASPFTGFQSIAVSVSFGSLAALAVARTDLTVSPKYPLIALGVSLIGIFALLFFFVLGHRRIHSRPSSVPPATEHPESHASHSLYTVHEDMLTMDPFDDNEMVQP